MLTAHDGLSQTRSLQPPFIDGGGASRSATSSPADACSSAGKGSEEAKQRAELAARYCEGDESAFRELYDLTAPRVFGYLICLVRHRTTAEEILQVVFMKLHQSRASYARGADPLPWIFTIAHRTFLDVARRRKRSRERLAPDSSFLELTVSSEVPPEDDDSPYGPELISAVLDALHKLPDNQREALLLTKIQGMSVTDAAALLGTTPGALKLRAHRAYVALRETFKPR